VRLACQDMYQDSKHNFTAMINKEWIAKRIFTNGFIWCGRMSEKRSFNRMRRKGELSSLFDIEEPETILTPLFEDTFDKKPMQYLFFERICWRTSSVRSGIKYIVPTRLKVKDMVRGMWSAGEADAGNFRIS
jgi:hypothetical protein